MGLEAATHLADTSAWHWSVCARERWDPMLESGAIATCDVVEMEYLFSARSSRHLEELLVARTALEKVEITQSCFDRAKELMATLSKKREFGHRSVKMFDLLIVATAEQTELVVLHYDADFDLIAEVTGQVCEWLSPKGTLHRL